MAYTCYLVTAVGFLVFSFGHSLVLHKVHSDMRADRRPEAQGRYDENLSPVYGYSNRQSARKGKQYRIGLSSKALRVDKLGHPVPFMHTRKANRHLFSNLVSSRGGSGNASDVHQPSFGMSQMFIFIVSSIPDLCSMYWWLAIIHVQHLPTP